MTPSRGPKPDAEIERFFPMVRPVIPGFDYFGDWRPAPGGGGDYIDYFEMNDGNLGLAVGDVCGKGASAAVLTSSVHSMIRALRFARTFSLKVLVKNIDKLFSEVSSDNCYATLFVGEYDPSSGRMHYVNAGHEPPFVLRRQGKHFQTLFLEASGPVIGMLREASYRESTISLRPGDVLVAYTDGLCKATSHAGEEWGWQRLLKAVEDCADERAHDIVEGVMRTMDAFAGGGEREDDVTLFVGRVQEPISQMPRWQEDFEVVAVAA